MLKAVAKIEQTYDAQLKARNAYWTNSAYGWLAQIGTGAQNSAVGKILIEWATKRNVPLSRATGTGTRLVLGNAVLRLKVSSAWLPSVKFRFQQVKERDTFDYLWLYGFTNSTAYMWIVTREEALQWWGQHTGAAATETKWSGDVDPKFPSQRLPGRGTEAETLTTLQKILAKQRVSTSR